MVEQKKIKIGDALKEVLREIKLDSESKYKLLGVKWYGKGVFLREEKYGKEIKATKLYQVKKGDFIYNRLFAWKASFAIIPEEYDGCLVSNEFPIFTCNEEKIIPKFLLNFILLPKNITAINNLSGGMSSVSRKRFKEAEFLNFEMPFYELEAQRRICLHINQAFVLLEQIQKCQAQAEDLLQSVLREAFASE